MEEEEARRLRLTEHVGDADSLAEAEEHSGIVEYWEDDMPMGPWSRSRKMWRRKTGRRAIAGSRATMAMCSAKNEI